MYEAVELQRVTHGGFENLFGMNVWTSADTLRTLWDTLPQTAGCRVGWSFGKAPIWVQWSAWVSS